MTINRERIVLCVLLGMVGGIGLVAAGLIQPMIAHGGHGVPAGGLVVVTQTTEASPGDTVVYRESNGLQLAGIVHSRTDASYRIGHGHYRTAISEDQVIGSPAISVPVAGNVIAEVRTPGGFAALIALLLVTVGWTVRRDRQV